MIMLARSPTLSDFAINLGSWRWVWIIWIYCRVYSRLCLIIQQEGPVNWLQFILFLDFDIHWGPPLVLIGPSMTSNCLVSWTPCASKGFPCVHGCDRVVDTGQALSYPQAGPYCIFSLRRIPAPFIALRLSFVSMCNVYYIPMIVYRYDDSSALISNVTNSTVEHPCCEQHPTTWGQC